MSAFTVNSKTELCQTKKGLSFIFYKNTSTKVTLQQGPSS
jgi:hypothetical protein